MLTATMQPYVKHLFQPFKTSPGQQRASRGSKSGARAWPLQFLLRTLSWGLFALWLGSCNPDKIGPQQVNPPPASALPGRQVYLTNEGNFQRGNASVTAYTPASGERQQQIYQARHDNPLGDVLQDMQEHQGAYYLVLNNSGLIRKVDTLSWQEEAVISDLDAPRFLAMNDSLGVVSQLFRSEVQVLHLAEARVLKTLAMPRPTGAVRFWQQHFVVLAGDHVVLLDSQAESKLRELKLSGTLRQMVEDQQGNLWILSSSTAGGQLWRLRHPQDSLRSFPLPAAGEFLAYNAQQNSLWVAAAGSVYRYVITSDGLSESVMIRGNWQSLYGFGLDPRQGEVYLSDALDFDQPADIYRYDSNGILLDQFKGGLITNGFYFEK